MEGGPPIFPRDSSCPAVLWIPLADSAFAYGVLTLCDLPSQTVRLNFVMPCVVLTPSTLLYPVWPLPCSLATTYGISVDFFSSPYLDVSVQAVPPIWLFIHHMVTDSSSAGLLHSDICGSMCICHSPQLFAACHVLLRLPVPRHSPCALFRLTSFAFQKFHPRTFENLFSSFEIVVFYPISSGTQLPLSRFPCPFRYCL